MRKTNAEIRQIELSNKKTTLEIQQLQAQMQEVKTRILGTLELGPRKVAIIEEEHALSEDLINDEHPQKRSQHRNTSPR